MRHIRVILISAVFCGIASLTHAASVTIATRAATVGLVSTSVLQKGTTLYVTSGTVQGQLTVGSLVVGSSITVSTMNATSGNFTNLTFGSSTGTVLTVSTLTVTSSTTLNNATINQSTQTKIMMGAGGTATSPTLNIVGSATTGIYSGTANILDFSNNGTQIFETSASSVTVSTRAFIAGDASNVLPSAGYVGEITTAAASAGFVNSGPSTQFTDIATMTLTAGQYIIVGNLNQNLNGAVQTRAQIAISINSDNSTGDSVSSVNTSDLPLPTAASNGGGSITLLNFNTPITRIVYLKYGATFASGQPQALGFMYALRRH